jgi:hypothetical protein
MWYPRSLHGTCPSAVQAASCPESGRLCAMYGRQYTFQWLWLAVCRHTDNNTVVVRADCMLCLSEGRAKPLQTCHYLTAAPASRTHVNPVQGRWEHTFILIGTLIFFPKKNSTGKIDNHYIGVLKV